MIEIQEPRQASGEDAGDDHQGAGDAGFFACQVRQGPGDDFVEPPAYGIHLVHLQVVDEAPDQATPGADDGAGDDDQPPGEDLARRARELIDEGIKQGSPIGRPRLARELRITEHQARQLLASHLANGASPPGDDLAGRTDVGR